MKFFFYGIFLSQSTRKRFNIPESSVRYDTVKDYITLGYGIVWAVPVSPTVRASLTGITAEVPANMLERLDSLEHGYHRITTETSSGERVSMYVAPGSEHTDTAD